MKKLKVLIVSMMLLLVMVGSSTFCWPQEHIAALEDKYGPNWTDYRHTQELKDFINYNNYRESIGVGGWDNPQDPPVGWQWGDPVDGSGSTSVSTPAVPTCEHDYKMKVTVQPSCLEEGEVTYTCSKCNKSYKESLEPLGEHEYVSEVSKEASCTEAGETTYTCSMCEDSYTEEILMVEHEYSSEVTVKVGCVEDGESTFTCELCGDSYTEPIPARGHSEGDFEITVANGWFSEGEQVQKCVACGEILATEVIPAQYPIWYLYVAIGFAVVLVGTIIGIVVAVKRKR